MFGIGGWEFIVIAMLALLLFGPDKLPQFARTLGRVMRDFKRYQALMESTIRGEILAADPTLQKDPFETAKQSRTKVGSGQFSRPASASDEAEEAAADEAGSGPATTEDGDLLEPDAGDLIAGSIAEDEAARDVPDEIAGTTLAEDDAGEGEQDRA